MHRSPGGLSLYMLSCYYYMLIIYNTMQKEPYKLKK